MHCCMQNLYVVHAGGNSVGVSICWRVKIGCLILKAVQLSGDVLKMVDANCYRRVKLEQCIDCVCSAVGVALPVVVKTTCGAHLCWSGPATGPQPGG